MMRYSRISHLVLVALVSVLLWELCAALGSVKMGKSNDEIVIDTLFQN